MKQVELVETAFTTVDKELQSLLMTPTWGLTAEQAAEAVQEAKDDAMVNSLDLKEEAADAAEGQSPCAGDRSSMQDAKRKMKAARLAKKLTNIEKGCVCHGTKCPAPPPAPSLPPAVCLGYNYCEYGCFCETNWFTGYPSGTQQKGTC